MNPISRRILQTTGIDAFNAIPESSSPTAASPAAVRGTFDPSTPFDSSMALVILVLLTALFFLGFFSVYIRRYSGIVSDPAPSPDRRYPRSKDGGLDPSAVNSLPLIPYGRTAKHLMIEECPICLSEFHERECVKLIPYCGHVFHPRCLDTWLASHVTCPLCRSTELFAEEEVCLDVAPDDCAPGDTWRHDGVRRTCSCSTLAHHPVLHRSASF